MSQSTRPPGASVALFLKGARVTSGLRATFFDVANRAGITPKRVRHNRTRREASGGLRADFLEGFMRLACR